MNLNELVKIFIFDPENPDTSYQLGLEYERLGQTASAHTFFLKAAERTNDLDLAYECLCRMHHALTKQGNRTISALAHLHKAIIIQPKRPEAYFLLSNWHERVKEYHLGYMYAELGLNFCDLNSKPLRGYVGYPGEYGLYFEKMVCAWWWGKRQECRDLLFFIKDKYANVLDQSHREAVQRNLSSIGKGGELRKVYDPKTMYPRLRYKFKGSENIQQNFSQVYQDMFVLGVYDGMREGTYLEIGAGGPFEKNNTALLEKDYGWKGIGIEIDPELVKYHARDRTNQVICTDAAQVDYDELLSRIAVNGVVNYLQVDCEPPATTFKIMTMIPFNKYKFGIITYEHDYYADVSSSYREQSRAYLYAKGYKLLVNDVSTDGSATFEDWWYHPDLISEEAVARYIAVDDKIKVINDYMFPSEPIVIESKPLKKDYWRATQWPTLEITTNIAEKGCVVDCAFCPQITLVENTKNYQGDRLLKLENFKKVIDKLPKDIRITFAGFTEPWLHSKATEMVEYAYAQGHPIAVFTTGVGMKPDDVYRLAKLKYAQGPNSGLVLHLPDQERIAKHPVNNTYISVVKAFKEIAPTVDNFYTMCMSDQVHEKVREFFPQAHVPEFWSRAGNLLNEITIKPDLIKVADRVKSIYHGEEQLTCNQPEDLYHNVLLPNGDVSLCCQDYSLKHIIGNLFDQEYDDILPKTNSCFDLCRYCENGIKPK
jgi:hypothetical protein